jgi:hypothetical protein
MQAYRTGNGPYVKHLVEICSETAHIPSAYS